MINSANTVDFNVINHGKVILPHGLVPLDKCKLVHTTKIPQSGGERFTSCAIQTSIKPYTYTIDNKRRADMQSAETKEIHMQPQRVHVQHLQTHPNLQNNQWFYDKFYNLNTERERTTPNGFISKINHNNNVIRKESAFSLSTSSSMCSVSNNSNNNNNNSNNNNNNSSSSSFPNTFKNVECDKDLVNIGVKKTAHEVSAHMGLTDRRTTSVYNTDYQENPFHRIEDVHNYAKMDRYSYSNESSNSSMHEEDNEDEDGELDEDLDDNNDDAATNYERYLRKSKHLAAMKVKCHEDFNMQITRLETEETELNVDVETVHKVQNETTEVAVPSTPDHHARRPMNAFLIFCKRHRAIVKERYRSLENRAITKILGDWWASLDATDKKCFTNLAQQNKDAFFNANPNFKWYKLPAPPLRTLNTRPGNTSTEPEDDMKSILSVQSGGAMLSKYTKNGNNHIFKLADEAQMGELSNLFSGESDNNNCNSNQNALQQALGETSQFLNAYMSPTSGTEGVQLNKNRLLSENSFSSNGSEDDILHKKSSRACKGKIYQELINSGQISAVSKKLKTPKSQSHPNGYAHHTVTPSSCTNLTSLDSCNQFSTMCTSSNNIKQNENSSCEGFQSNNDMSSFDLEDKIKELPALSLDLYLQRKRNTKKKKKFTSKKRHSTNAGHNKNSGSLNVPQMPTVSCPNRSREAPPQQAVGSQKRKARKESITRRDVTVIEKEIASVIPLAKNFNTINGCYYFNASPDATISKCLPFGEITNSTATTGADNQRADVNVFGNLCNDNSSTSDLLILAEVAANRTELTN
ncbi:serine/threonine-protein kinase pakD [Zeugodacus cucurbitae]|uniref:serine/threonine-protein kinase pakD n=1 Tax=Zeugodacus cucurbitae TaxID=28588 RepID=UPI0023D914B3|nr:serine/threonine-protein kinase pakD [Zeugodacus cucurbitae]XP_011187571.2 serine/threonine-protein kinase pakD [Zeugodacus cucurbitae]XP_028898192.2 serine/threonine-protein kinase pakD [Zeugodacus cucurbitae]XP_028898193.2 serine/threonine-protein kinase pakD [Zeugodacus cucurbitae]XP_028898194.2 serine/threonine-protein kinase pakD [Zeugodacus cucurbitae]XP_054086751.1 serine/threonine-protein kinase pakD [Zeugodacus cucurbitae]